ncbi:MAG: pyridoxamine 5'-phosphate oxidase [Candidatus Kapabacteria bacterium]|nr:pyridoxamine 5'-phosphate oxidase [Candidatus Kapabacteria bacterium]
MRKEYAKEELTEESVQREPFGQFSSWFDEAVAASLPEPTAMVLSTVSAQNKPSSRVVLMKGLDEHGFVWFTNYESKKGRDLASNPFASLLFFWPELERQVRIEGHVSKISQAESLKYFVSRPLESRLGAWASFQSLVVESRDILHRQFENAKARFSDGEVPLPPSWGGYRLTPTTYEFWQGRPSRMHDRIQYSKDGNAWAIERLSP